MKPRLIVCSVSLWTACSLHAVYFPIAIQSSSYNADVIVEQDATPRLTLCTSASIDGGTNNCSATWFERGFDTSNPEIGLPPAGSTFTALADPLHSFQMPPTYTTANGLLLDASVTHGTFTLVNPANYASLSFLGSGSDGGCVARVQVNHEDGSAESGTISIPDWFGNPANVACLVGGRISQVDRLNPEVDGPGGDGKPNPRLYFEDIPLTNTASAVTSVTLNLVSSYPGAHTDIMAVSGATAVGGPTAPIAVNGYTYDFVVEASAPRYGRIVSQTVLGGTNKWSTTQSMGAPDNTGETWYEQGYNLNNAASYLHNSPADDLTRTGLPHPGNFITNTSADHIYQLPPDYATNDAIFLDEVQTNDLITLAAPASYDALSFLGAAGYGPITIKAVINHQSGSSETNLLAIKDWFDGSAPYAYIANGLVLVDLAWFQSVNSGFPRLLQSDLPVLDATNPIISIYLENTNTAAGGLAIFAISGSSGSIIGLPPYPASVAAYVGSSCNFTTAILAAPPIRYQWQKGTNNLYVNVTDGGNISGAATTNLSIVPVQFSDQASYRLSASNAAGIFFSAPGTLSVFSTNTDVTQPGDVITAFGGKLFGDGQVANAIDNDMATKFGMTLSNAAPFPSGLVVSPSVGTTIVNAVRFYTANDSSGRDPSDFKLEGSRDGGNTFALIASNSLSLPYGRNSEPAGTPPNPLTQFVQEVRFTNVESYTTYRLTSLDYQGGAGTTQMQIGEVEFLGVPIRTVLTATLSDARILNLIGSGGVPGGTFSILTSTNLELTASNWAVDITGTFDGDGKFSVTIPAGTDTHQRFYRLKAP